LGGTRMNDNGLVKLGGELELGSKGSLLVFARGVVAVIVKARLADRHALLVLGQVAQFPKHCVVKPRRLVWMAADRRVHGRELFGGLKRGATRLAGRAHGDDPGNPGRHRGVNQLRRGRFAHVEVGVAVDQARFGNSGSSGSAVPPTWSRHLAGAKSRSWTFSACSNRSEVAGMYG